MPRPDRLRLVVAGAGGAVLCPPLVAIYQLVLGYSIGDPAMLSLVLYVVSLGVIGALVGVGLVLGLRGAPIVSIVYILVAGTNPLFGQSPSAVGGTLLVFVVDVAILAVFTTMFSAGEYWLRHPNRVGQILTPRAWRWGIGIGSINLVAGIVTRWVVFGLPVWRVTLFSAALYGWVLGGTFLTGGVVGVLWGRFRLYSPPVTLVVLFAWAVFETVPKLTAFGDISTAAAFTPITAYIVFWPVITGIAGGVGLLEYLVRPRTRKPG